MERADVQALFRKFAAPLAGYAATSPARKELAEMLARNLWAAMIAGPEMEEETWKVFKKHANLDDSARPAWLLVMWGQGDVSWGFVQTVSLWFMAIYKFCVWLLILVVLWLTLWARQLRKADRQEAK